MFSAVARLVGHGRRGCRVKVDTLVGRPETVEGSHQAHAPEAAVFFIDADLLATRELNAVAGYDLALERGEIRPVTLWLFYRFRHQRFALAGERSGFDNSSVRRGTAEGEETWRRNRNDPHPRAHRATFQKRQHFPLSSRTDFVRGA